MIPDAPIPPGKSQGPPGSQASATPLRLERRARQRPGDPVTILLIEDDEIVRTLVRRYLTHDGYTVLEAEDGQAGLEMLEQHSGQIDLVLTDIDMPRIDGITVAGILAALRPLVGVVCMSGTATGWDPGEQAGALDRPRFLAKPFTAERLTSVLDDELERVQKLAAAAESSQTVSRALAIERRLMLVVDLVASGLRLQSQQPAPMRLPLEALHA